MGVLLSGCQLIPVKTIGIVEEEPEVVQETGTPISEGETIDVSQSINRTIIINASKPIVFENKGTIEVMVKIMLDREIETIIVPGGKFSFNYPGGFESVKVSWSGGEVMLKKG